MQKGKEKSFLSFSESDSDDDNEAVEDDMLNFVAFAATTAKVVFLEESESEEEEDVNSKEAYRILFDSWVQLSKDKLVLVQEKLRLEAKVELLEETENDDVSNQITFQSHSTDNMEGRFKVFQEKYIEERDRASLLEQELSANYKKIRMLNTGSQNLDKILAMGRVDSHHRGLGYQGGASSSGYPVPKPITFVKECRSMGESHNGPVTEKSKKDERDARYENRVPRLSAHFHASLSSKVDTVSHSPTSHFRGCYHFGKTDRRTSCYKLKARRQLLWKLRKCWYELSSFGSVWVKKGDLYGKMVSETECAHLMAV